MQNFCKALRLAAFDQHLRPLDILPPAARPGDGWVEEYAVQRGQVLGVLGGGVPILRCVLRFNRRAPGPETQTAACPLLALVQLLLGKAG